jgi:hypothetical protein
MTKRNAPNLAQGEPSAITLDDHGALHPSAQAAGMLGVEESTLAQWRCAGIGPAYFKIGRRAYYAAEDLAQWIEAQRREPAAARAARRAASRTTNQS